MAKALGIILAGGQGKRMDLLCYLRPKPALPFAGNLRVIDFSLSNCIHSKVEKMGVLVDYQRTYMADYLRQWAADNAESTKVSVLPPAFGSYAGTADAIYRNLAYLYGQSCNIVLVLAGDHIYRMDYRKMLDFHDKINADVTVGIVRVPVEEAHRFGTVVINDESRILEFVEKVPRPLSNLASMGIYIFNTDILVKRLVEDAMVQDSLHDFGYSILPNMVERDRVFAYEFDGYWQDIGTVEAYYQANMELLTAHPRFSLDSDWPVLSNHDALPMPEGSEDDKIVNSVIGPGCVIKGRVENSILSPGVHVSERAIIRNSVVMADTYIGHHSIVDGCILDERVNIGNFCYIGFGAALLHRNSGVTVLGQYVTVPDRTAIGRKCRIKPGLGLAAFDARVIPDGTPLMTF